MEKSEFAKMIDKLCKLHPEGRNYHEVRVETCNEFLSAVNGMPGTELEPYLAEMKAVPREGCYSITFKIPLVSYGDLTNSTLERGRK